MAIIMTRKMTTRKTKLHLKHKKARVAAASKGKTVIKKTVKKQARAAKGKSHAHAKPKVAVLKKPSGRMVTMKVKVADSKHKDIPEAPVVNKSIDDVIGNTVFVDYMSKNVGRRSIDIVQFLNEIPQTDDKLALKLGVKVNEVRRMLNVLNSYSITRYDINKDSKGWLTFKWYLDREKLRGFNAVLNEKENAASFKLQENCNDFFFCKSCYKDQKVILPFDAAFEISFKCECGNALSVLNKEEATTLFKEEGATPSVS